MGNKKNKHNKNNKNNINNDKRAKSCRLGKTYSIYNMTTESINSYGTYLPFSTDFSGVLPAIYGMPGDRLSEYVLNYYKISLNSRSKFKAVDEAAEVMKSYVERSMCFVMNNCTDMPKEINILNEEAKNAIIDRIDARKYLSENGEYPQISLNAISSLQEIGDIGAFWSTSRFMDIIISDSIFVRMCNNGYNKDNNTISYFMCIYTKFRASDNVYITIPVMRYAFEIGVMGDRVVVSKNCPNPNNLDMLEVDIGYAKGPLKRYIVNKGLYPYIKFNGVVDFYDCVSYLKSEKSWGDIGERDSLLRALGLMDLDRSFSNQPLIVDNKIKNILSATFDIALYALLVTNKYIKDRKISRPKNKYDDIIGEFEPVIRTNRKRRTIGDMIEIDSVEAPQLVTVERMINYHVTEWGRKAHLRHMKDGRIIEVKASQCKRKSTDGYRRTKAIEKGTDYMIKAD